MAEVLRVRVTRGGSSGTSGQSFKMSAGQFSLEMGFAFAALVEIRADWLRGIDCAGRVALRYSLGWHGDRW